METYCRFSIGRAKPLVRQGKICGRGFLRERFMCISGNLASLWQERGEGIRQLVNIRNSDREHERNKPFTG